MRIMGIDYGTKRMGIALSDELMMIAQPFEFILAKPIESFLDRLKEIIRDKEVERIVIGMPLHMNGSHGLAAEKVDALIKKLKETVDLPITTWDERLSSVEANRILIAGNVSRKKRKEKVDKTAAAIILQSYLDSQA
ncbi:MAG: Holliday junction resolvase RuvX [Verrucomicrobiia bacterium]